MSRRILFFIMLVSLIFISFFNIIGNPSLPTWRIFNIVFVLSAFIFFFKIPRKEIPIDILVTQIVFFGSIVLQCIRLVFLEEFGGYEANFLVALFFLLCFCFYFYLLTAGFPRVILHTLVISILINFGYQLFQFFSFLFGKPKWVVLLNQPDVVKTSNIYRIVGPFLGPPGFMSESGQLALFLGPFLIYLIILDYYKIFKINVFVVACILTSMVITFSGGSFIQFGFIGLTFMIINKEKFMNLKFLAFIVLLFLLFVVMLQNEQYYSLIEYRIMSIFTGDSYRNVGALAYLEAFYENFFFGVAPKASRFISSDPNTFIPILLADHGIVGGITFLFMFFVPVLLAFVRSKRKYFVMPFFAMTVHLFLAYGTYSWPFIWIIYVLTIEGLDRNDKKIDLKSL